MKEASFYFAGGFAGVGDYIVDGFIDGNRILVNPRNLLVMVKGVLDVVPQVAGDKEAIESAMAILNSPMEEGLTYTVFDVTETGFPDFEMWMDAVIEEEETVKA